jgi:hypothetical protein
MTLARPDASPGSRRARALVVLGCLALTGCGGTGTVGPVAAAPGTTAPAPAGPDTVVLQVARTGGYSLVEVLWGRLPAVTVYADGRVLAPGPVGLVDPPTAWPGISVTQLDPARLPELVDRALAAGVAEEGSLGPAGVTDAPSTRFTVQTPRGTVVRQVDALVEGLGSPMLSDEQRAARQRLADLAEELTGLTDPARSWTPEEVAVLAHPTAPGLLARDGTPLDVPELAWTGPALPGERLTPGLGCTVVPVAEVRAAAAGASTLTPWTTPDGARWSLTFRPLLPHESGCADLTG